MALKEQVKEAVAYLLNQIDMPPLHAITLGTGLKDIVRDFPILKEIKVGDIPHFPAMTVEHMDASLYVIKYKQLTCWILGGRLHYYEGYSMEQVSFPIRLLAEAGTLSFFFTNAAGNVNRSFKAGDLVLIRDHINWSFPSPLIGPNEAEWGPRYPEMINVYHPATNEFLLKFASDAGIQLDQGVYLGGTGPQLETLAEYRLFHQLGADMVGMSTIPEVIVATHMNRKITALSVLSNDAADTPEPTSTDIAKIMNTIKSRQKDVGKLIRHWMEIEL